MVVYITIAVKQVYKCTERLYFLLHLRTLSAYNLLALPNLQILRFSHRFGKHRVTLLGSLEHFGSLRRIPDPPLSHFLC